MFWKRKPTETERITAEAVDIAANIFETVALHGSDFTGWGDAKDIGASNIYFQPSRAPQLYVRGAHFNLAPAQAEKLHNIVRRRALLQVSKPKEPDQ